MPYRLPTPFRDPRKAAVTSEEYTLSMTTLEQGISLKCEAGTQAIRVGDGRWIHGAMAVDALTCELSLIQIVP